MKGNERLENYLNGIRTPACESSEHRNRLRRQVMEQVAANQPGMVSKRNWRVAALVAGLLCAGALVAQVTVQVQRYFFQGRTRDGAYRFSTKPETIYVGTGAGATGGLQGVTVVQQRTTTIDPEDLGPGGVEQAQRDLEELDALRQDGAREIVGVTETEVNGHYLGRVFECKYVLADGREETMREAGADWQEAATPAQIEQDQKQIEELRQQNQREITTVVETEVDSQISRTLICRYVLADGREVTLGEGDRSLGNSHAILSEGQWEELGRLKDLKAGTLIDTLEKQLFGKNFTFVRHSYQLLDGTVVIRSEGQPAGSKRNLSEENWDELARLRKAGAGELLGNYEQEVQGKMFSFEKRRYLLSDGTEVIRANGVVKGAQ